MHIIDELLNTRKEIIPGKWVICRPMRGPLGSRIKDAVAVLKGKADAVKFIGQ